MSGPVSVRPAMSTWVILVLVPPVGSIVSLPSATVTSTVADAELLRGRRHEVVDREDAFHRQPVDAVGERAVAGAHGHVIGAIGQRVFPCADVRLGGAAVALHEDQGPEPLVGGRGALAGAERHVDRRGRAGDDPARARRRRVRLAGVRRVARRNGRAGRLEVDLRGEPGGPGRRRPHVGEHEDVVLVVAVARVLEGDQVGVRDELAGAVLERVDPRGVRDARVEAVLRVALAAEAVAVDVDPEGGRARVEARGAARDDRRVQRLLLVEGDRGDLVVDRVPHRRRVVAEGQGLVGRVARDGLDADVARARLLEERRGDLVADRRGAGAEDQPGAADVDRVAERVDDLLERGLVVALLAVRAQAEEPDVARALIGVVAADGERPRTADPTTVTRGVKRT